MNGFCNALNCGKPVPPETFACSDHWLMIPAEIRRRIWRLYRGDHRDEGNPEWVAAVQEAREAIGKREFERCIQEHGAACGCWQAPKNVVGTP